MMMLCWTDFDVTIMVMENVTCDHSACKRETPENEFDRRQQSAIYSSISGV